VAAREEFVREEPPPQPVVEAPPQVVREPPADAATAGSRDAGPDKREAGVVDQLRRL
jgi:hypothetical protein